MIKSSLVHMGLIGSPDHYSVYLETDIQESLLGARLGLVFGSIA